MGLARQRQTELRLDLSLQPKQSQLWRLVESAGATTIGFGGARGGAKSGAIRRIALIRRIHHPGTAALIFRRVYDDLKKNHIDKFLEEFPDLLQYYRATDKEVIIPNEPGRPPSRIAFGYAETESEVKRKFHGPEFMDIFIDQAEQLSETEIKVIKTANRWPGVPERTSKLILAFNPGGIGISYLKRVFKDQEFRDGEKAGDFAFIQAYGSDNVEWMRSALIEDGVSENDFYQWPPEQRFDYFITRSQYGQELNALPEALKVGYLLGEFDAFAGQFFDIWNPVLHTQRPENLEIQSWHPRWVSCDWGYHNEAAIYWHAQVDGVTKTYREFVAAGLGPIQLANKLVAMTRLEREKEHIEAIYLSPDAFAKRTTEDSVADQLRHVLVENKMPAPRRADDDRIGGWRLMYDLMKYGQWIVSTDCPRLIKTIPLASRDEKDLEDLLKFSGDDPIDSARYGLKSRFTSVPPPREVEYRNAMLKVELRNQDKGAEVVNTMKHLANLRWQAEWQRKHAPFQLSRRFRRNH
jgi:hypothetical protein